MKANWQATIEQLYAAFKTVPKPRHVEGCPCCTSEGEFRHLLAKPLRDVSPDELGRYASKALTTVGTEDDFHYFIPRILEVSATECGWWPEPAIVLGKMQMADWQSWPSEQVSAVRAFLWVNFLRVLEQEDCGSDLDDWICAVGRGGEDLSPYLAQLERQPVKLVLLYEDNSESLLKGRLSNPFWEGAASAEEAVVKWFRSSDVVEVINKTCGMES
ncbi:MAG TPA: hypothetical protein VK846_18025 [Candidatus Limnocylindria bacterium]|nr:hypothetical protein [Candidatus Limnocylindria bacterium]